jgi:hypothetical protein
LSRICFFLDFVLIQLQFSYPFLFSFFIGLLGIATYSTVYPPDLNEGLTGVLTSFGLGNVIRYYFDPDHTGSLPVATLIMMVVTFVMSFILLDAGFEIGKLVSSLEFTSAASSTTGAYTLRVDNIPKNVHDAKIVCFFLFYFYFILFLYYIIHYV